MVGVARSAASSNPSYHAPCMRPRRMRSVRIHLASAFAFYLALVWKPVPALRAHASAILICFQSHGCFYGTAQIKLQVQGLGNKPRET